MICTLSSLPKGPSRNCVFLQVLLEGEILLMSFIQQSPDPTDITLARNLLLGVTGQTYSSCQLMTCLVTRPLQSAMMIRDNLLYSTGMKPITTGFVYPRYLCKQSTVTWISDHGLTNRNPLFLQFRQLVESANIVQFFWDTTILPSNRKKNCLCQILSVLPGFTRAIFMNVKVPQQYLH